MKDYENLIYTTMEQSGVETGVETASHGTEEMIECPCILCQNYYDELSEDELEIIHEYIREVNDDGYETISMSQICCENSNETDHLK